MQIKRVRALAIPILLLGLQVASLILATDRSWPFVDYSMYSRAHPPGSTFTLRRLAAEPCQGGPARSLDYLDARVMPKVLNGLMNRAVQGEAGARHSLDALLREPMAERDLCTVSILERTFTITARGLASRTVPEVTAARWTP